MNILFLRRTPITDETQAIQPDGPYVDAYTVLGEPNDADKPDIKTVYRKLAIKHHPDKFTDPAEKQVKSTEFQILGAAYDTLINDFTRAHYDHLLQSGRVAEYQRWITNRAVVKRGNEKYDDSPPSRKKHRQAGMLVTQGFIQEQKINAMPDTGAGYNLIASSLAQVLGFARPQSQALGGLKIRMANEKSLRTIGVIEAIWSFEADTRETWTLTFHIIEDFFCDAVLGKNFLLATQTMSKHQHRLSRIPPPIHALSVLYVNSLGHVTQCLRGSINNLPVDVLPDSGSESNLLSFEYIQHNGWDNDLDLQDVRLLLFPDGTVERIMGSLRRHWRCGAGAEVHGVELDFHILYGYVYDAILGEEMLETQAFTEHQDAFVDAARHKDPRLVQSELNLVIWLPFKRSKKRKQEDSNLQETPVDEPIATATSLSAGLKRRATTDHAIKRMKNNRQRDDALAEENEIRRHFDIMNSESFQTLSLGSSSNSGSSTTGDSTPRLLPRDTSTEPAPMSSRWSQPLYDTTYAPLPPPSTLIVHQDFPAPDLDERRKRMSPGASFHPRLLGY